MATMTGKTAAGVEVAVQVDDNGVVQVATGAVTALTDADQQKLDQILAELQAIKAHLGI